MKKLFAVLVLSFSVLTQSWAASVSNSQGAATSTVTANWNATTGSLTYSWAYTNGVGPDGRNWASGGWLYLVSGEGVTSGTVIFDNSAPTSPNGSGSTTIAPGQWVLIAARNVTGDAGPLWYVVNPDEKRWFRAVDPATGNATKEKSQLIKFENTTDHKLMYTVKDQDGNIIAQFYVNPGETLYRQFQRDSNDDGTWTLTPSIVGATAGGDGRISYTGNPSDIVNFDAQNFLTTSDFTSGSNPGISGTSVTSPTITNNTSALPPVSQGTSGPPEINQYRGTVVYSGASGAAATDALKTADYKEGTDQIVGELKLINQKLKKVDDRDAQAQKDADAAASTGQSRLTTKQNDAKSAFTSAVPDQTSITGGTSPGSGSFFSLQVPKEPGVKASVNADPTANPKLAVVAAWIKGFLAFLVSGWLTWWAYGELREHLFFSSLLQPAKGNTVAGSGGQITSAIVAAWLTLVLVALPTAIVATWTGAPIMSAVYGTSREIFADAPSGIGSAGVYLIYSVVPVATIATALTSMFVIRKAGMVIYFGVAAACRWAIA